MNAVVDSSCRSFMVYTTVVDKSLDIFSVVNSGFSPTSARDLVLELRASDFIRKVGEVY